MSRPHFYRRTESVARLAKKIISALARGLLMLLVLVLALTSLLNYQKFFGPAVTWALVACVGVLILFVIYLTISWVLNAVRKHGSDEDSLNEQSIEQILSGEAAHAKPIPYSAKKRKQPKQKKPERKAEEDNAPRKQDVFEAKKAEEEAAKRKKLEQEEARHRAEAEAKIKKITDAETSARKRAEQAKTEEEQQLALAEADAFRRAAMEAQKRMAEDEAARLHALLLREEREKAEQEVAAKKMAQAIESARKQAEAAATARRRAAQISARTQSFAAITGDTIPTFNTQIIEKATDVSDGRLPLPAAFVPRTNDGEQDTHSEENLWDKMQVRQSAAPVLSTGPGAKKKSETSGWTYSPAKLPNAWTADSTNRKIPGDMSFTGAAVKPDETDAKAPTTKKPAATASTTKTKPAAKPAATSSAGTPVGDAPADPPKRPRGRPPKPKTEEELNQPKRPRGRPPKPKTEEELNQPKRPRGRPRKNPLPEDQAAAPAAGATAKTTALASAKPSAAKPEPK